MLDAGPAAAALAAPVRRPRLAVLPALELAGLAVLLLLPLRLESFGLEVAPTDGPALAAFIQKETTFWHALIKERHLSLD